MLSPSAISIESHLAISSAGVGGGNCGRVVARGWLFMSLSQSWQNTLAYCKGQSSPRQREVGGGMASGGVGDGGGDSGHVGGLGMGGWGREHYREEKSREEGRSY